MASAATKYVPQYTVEEYLNWPGDWELWRGVPVAMSPAPTPVHQLVAAGLFTVLNSAIGSSADCNCIALYETDWRIDSETVVRPDISVLCSGLPSKYIDYAPSVIAEILSPSTAGKDLTAKRALYAEQGVSIYLLVDPDEQTVTALRLESGSYVELPTNDSGDVTIHWNGDCQATVSTATVFQGLQTLPQNEQRAKD